MSVAISSARGKGKAVNWCEMKGGGEGTGGQDKRGANPVRGAREGFCGEFWELNYGRAISGSCFR